MNKVDVILRLKALETRLREHGVAALYLFGSYARDEARADSDIDLLADFEDGRDSDIMDFLAPYEDLEEAFPGTEIGFSTRDRLVALYRPSIETSAIRIFWALVRGSANERSPFFDGSAYLVAPVEAWQRTDFGRPRASIRLRMATPIAASVC